MVSKSFWTKAWSLILVLMAAAYVVAGEYSLAAFAVSVVVLNELTVLYALIRDQADLICELTDAVALLARDS